MTRYPIDLEKKTLHSTIGPAPLGIEPNMNYLPSLQTWVGSCENGSWPLPAPGGGVAISALRNSKVRFLLYFVDWLHGKCHSVRGTSLWTSHRTVMVSKNHVMLSGVWDLYKLTIRLMGSGNSTRVRNYKASRQRSTCWTWSPSWSQSACRRWVDTVPPYCMHDGQPWWSTVLYE